jgi:hypothetical protein
VPVRAMFFQSPSHRVFFLMPPVFDSAVFLSSIQTKSYQNPESHMFFAKAQFQVQSSCTESSLRHQPHTSHKVWLVRWLVLICLTKYALVFRLFGSFLSNLGPFLKSLGDLCKAESPSTRTSQSLQI